MADEPSLNDDTGNGAPPRGRGRIVLFAIVVLVLLSVVAVLVARNNDEASPPPTTQSAPTSTTSTSIDQKVLVDYRAFWDAYLAASNPMRPDDPGLAAHATGEQYGKLVNSFSGAKASNVVFKGTIDNRPKVTSIDGDTAQLRDCLADNTGSYDATSGERKDAASGTRDIVEVTLQQIDGTWKVSRSRQTG